MGNSDLDSLKEKLRQFADERDWDQFDVHGSTNVAGGRKPGATTAIIKSEWN